MDRLIPPELTSLLAPEQLATAARIGFVIVGGFLSLKLVAFIVGRVVERRFSAQSKMIVKKAIVYTGIIVIIMTVLGQLGLNLTTLLGAAGIAGIALGFAAQTSVSNVISGVFLISEKSFTIGDVIKVGSTSGIVLTIDLLSVKIRTFDNQYVRIPNETLIKSEVTNITRFPIRRLNIEFTVAYGTDLAVLKNALIETARANPNSLDNPEPIFFINSFGPRGIDVFFGVWFEKSELIKTRNSMYETIKQRLEAEGIEIPVSTFVVT